MYPKMPTLVRCAHLLALCLLSVFPIQAQTTGATLSGTVTDASRSLVPKAKVTVKNLATGQSTESLTNLLGFYSVPNLAPGDYEVSVSDAGFATKVAKVTLAAGTSQTLDFTLVPASTAAPELSLQDLGFSPTEVKGSPQEQALLDKRTHMLQIHQRLGLITTAPMLATVITSLGAKGHHGVPGNSTGRNVHSVLGATTAGMYFTTAYFAIRAPKVPGTETHGHIRLHKGLAWVHGTGMILTPILGGIAYSQLSNGERVHGIASAHSEVALVTFGAYVAAMLAVSVK
ncbi:MAG TPA: carboxypeptidase-like regulatory domain-containing protein [Terriglobia bacterium]|nr:carboxypeptidase-like regulatory domain-containing protein [Terriglobia bacterium]